MEQQYKMVWVNSFGQGTNKVIILKETPKTVKVRFVNSGVQKEKTIKKTNIIAFEL